MEKRQRKRVPLSCLNCKKRKVRCDKNTPCSGCVKNNVGHLCVYVEPNWAELLAKLTQVAKMVVTDLAEYKQLKEEMATMESKYKKEVEEMKRELDRLRGGTTSSYGETVGGGSEFLSAGGSGGVAGTFGGSLARITGGIGDIAYDPKSQLGTRRLYEGGGGSSSHTSKFPDTSSASIPSIGNPPPSMGDSPVDSPMTILQKLRNSPQSGAPEVADNVYFSMKHFRHENTLHPSGTMVKLYLWLNIIKLDPQLTALWYKITNMQKSYHMYKTSLLGQMRGGASDAHPLASTSVDSPACGHHKCPVVACEFNMMVEESNQAGTAAATPASGSGSESTSRPMSRAGSQALVGSGDSDAHNSLKVKKEEMDIINNLNDNAVGLLTRIQRLWREIRNYGRGDGMLSYGQLLFLLDFYLRDGTHSSFYSSVLCCDVESQHLFLFFRPNLMNLFRQDGEEVGLNILVFLSNMRDSEVYSNLKQQGIYVSILALIVEESLDALRLRVGLTPEIITEFHAVFPQEADHDGLGYKQNTLLDQVRSFVESMVKNKKSEVWSLVLTVCVILALLNRYIAVYKRTDVVSDGSSLFTSVFTRLLDLIDLDGDRLELWADPAQVTFKGSQESKNRQKELRLLLCQVWVDFMRIVNLAVLSVIPIVKHLHRLDRLLESFLEMINSTESAHSHVKYLAKFGDADPSVTSVHLADLITSLHVNYLIARASILIRNGICISSVRAQVCSGDFLKCLTEIQAWASNIALTKLRMTKYFEVRAIFNYLDLYFSFVVFLQFEENGDYSTVANLIPHLFAKALDLNKFLQGSIIQFSKCENCQYVQVVIAENMSKVSHLIAGLLIRFVADPATVSSGMEPSPTRLVYSQRSELTMPTYIPVSDKDSLIAETDRTIQLLENSLANDSVVRAVKIWRFYMTFIRNSHKMSPAAYARLHADAFGSGGINKCPVMPNLNNVISTPLPKMACPVAHVPPPSRSPIDHVVAPLVQPESRKRQCPFDHEVLRTSNLSLGQTFNESNIRGQESSTRSTQSSLEQSYTDVPLLKAEDGRRSSSRGVMVAVPSVTTTQNLHAPDPLGVDSLDWDTLPNFNFDLVGDEGLLMLINGGYIDNLPSIEAMFQ